MVLFFYSNTLCYSLPSDPTAISGEVQFERVNDNTMNITASANSILEYSAFNIGAGETVNFFLPDSGSFSLNRILGGGASDIMGNLFSNGNLILINSFGFNFGSSANVDAGSLIASTLNMSNENFLAGNFTFSNQGAGPFSQIINDGLINTENGFTVLIAPSIENNGTITAPLGTVALASGNTVTVGLNQDNSISIAVEAPVSGQVFDSEGNEIADQIKNTGTLSAEGGKIILNAKGADELFDQALNIQGHVSANHAEIGKDGVIEIISSGRNTLGGEISASGSITIAAHGSAEYHQAENSAVTAGGDFIVSNGVLLEAENALYTIGGDWINNGTFDPGTSSVVFNDASQDSVIYGNNEFYNFSVLTPSKVMRFEAGKTQNILGALTTRGAYGQHVRLLSTEEGSQWMINPSGARDLTYTWVEDSVNVNAEKIIMTESTNRGNSVNWDPTGTWTNGGGNMLWTNPLNWSGLGGATPGAGDDIVFNGTSTSLSFVDAGFAGTIGSLSLNAGYSGTLTLQRSLTVTTASGALGNVTINSGTFDLNSQNLTVHGNLMNLSSGLTAANSTLIFAGSAAQIFNYGTNNYHSITHSGSGILNIQGGDGSITLSNDLTISAGTVNIGGTNLTMSGTFSNDGILSLIGSETITGLTQDTNSGTIRFTGDGDGSGDTYYIDNSNFSGSYYNLTIASTDSGDEYINNGSAVTVAGAMTLSNGTYSVGGSATTTVTGLTTVSGGTYNDASGNTQTFNAGLTVSGGTFTGGAGTVDVNDELIISGSSTFTAPSGSLLLSDDFTVSGSPTFNHNSGTITFDSGTKNQAFTTNGISLNNVIMNNTHLPGVLTISGNLDVNGNLTLTSGNLNLSTNDPNVNIAGNMSVADGAVINVSSYTGTFTFDGSGTSTLTDNTAAGTNFGSITVDGTSKTIQLAGSSSGFTFSTLTTGADDTFSLNTENVTISTLSNNGNFRLQGSESVTLSSNDTDSGTWIYTGDNDGGIDAYAVKDFGATDYYNLTIASADSNDTYTLAAAQSIAGALTVSGGNFAPSTYRSTVTGLTTVSGGNLGSSTDTLTFNGGLTVSGGVVAGSAGNVDINGNLTLSSGTFTAPSSGALTVSGNWTKSGGTFTHNSGTVTFDGSGTQTLNSGTDAFYNLTHSGSGTLQLSTNLLVLSNNLTNSSGTLDLNGQNWTMTGATFSNSAIVQLRGSETITGLTQDTDSGTFLYVGDGDSASDTYTVKDFGATDYYNLTITSSDASDIYSSGGAKTVAGALSVTSGTYTANTNTTSVTGLATVSGGTYTASSAAQTFNGGLTVSGGTFTGSTGDVDVNGVLTLSSGTLTAPTTNSSFTVSDDFLVTGGTFTSNTGKVTLDSTTTATVNAPVGGLSFYDLEIASSAGKTVQFTGGDTFTVTNANTFTVGNNATLTSTDGTAWNLNVNNAGGSTTGITFGTGVSIAYANNTSANTISALNVTDGGNNTRLSFNGGAGSGGASNSGSGTTGGSIDPGINSGFGSSESGASGNTSSSSNQSSSSSSSQSSSRGSSNGGGGNSGGSGGGNGGGNGNGGPSGPSSMEYYFNEPKRTQTKVSVVEGIVYVLDLLGRSSILKANQSSTVKDSNMSEFKDPFYKNHTTPEKFKTTVTGQAYTTYLNEEKRNTVFFITDETGPVTFYYKAKPTLVQPRAAEEKKNA